MTNKPSLQSAVVKSVWSINYFLWEFKSDAPKKKYYGRHREQEMERGGLLQTNVFAELKVYVRLNLVCVLSEDVQNVQKYIFEINIISFFSKSPTSALI